MRLPKRPSVRPMRRPTRRRPVHLLVESLEDRLELALVAAGSEFHVNTTVANEQRAPAVAMDPNGDFVVAWQGGTNYQGPAPYDIFIQRYNPAGTPQGGEVRVNTTTSDEQTNPAVAMDATGDFVVTWESFTGSDYDIFAQRFSAAGAPQGSEFRVNTTVGGNQANSAVAMDAAGNFVVAWVNGAGVGADVHAQRYNASGVPQGSEYVVNVTTTGPQLNPAVGMDSTGNFVVAWQDSSGIDGNGNGVLFRRFDASGGALTGEVVANSTTAGNQDFPSIAVNASGGFVVAWRADGLGGSDVFARSFNSAGVALGADVRVNTTTANAQILPAVAIDSQGNALVVWQSAQGQDGSGDGVYAQRISPSGSPLGGEFRVNTTVANNQNQVAVASDANGQAVVVWRDQGKEGASNGYGVYAQRYQVVNVAPTLGPISNVSISENAGAQTVNLSGISAGSGELQALTVTATSSNPGLIPNPTVTYTSPNATGSLSFTPAANQSGTATITVTVTDDGGTANGGVNTITRTFTVTVVAVNHAPTLDAIPDPAPILEDAGAQTINLTGISAGAGESQALTITTTSSNPGLIPAPAVTYTSPNATGSLSYTPVANASGTATITVTITDNGGTANGGVNTVTRTFTVTVNAVNDAPTLDAIADPAPILEDAGAQTINLTGISAGGGESQNLTVTATSSNPGLIPNPTVTYTSPNATGSLSFTPVANASGTATITVTVTDNGGTANGGVNTVTRTFTVTVGAVNNAPTLDAIPDPAPILEDAGAQTINLTGITAGVGESQTLTITATSSNPGLIPNPTVTYTSPNTTGSLSYTPAANASGTATITVTVTDNGGTANGGVNTVTRTFTVTVNAVNDAPTLDAIADPAPILEDAGVQTISLSGITAGGGESQGLTITATSSNPSLIPNPTVTYTSPNATGSLSYTPVANASGTATITVTVTDNGGTANGGVNTVTRTFTVTVGAVNNAPTLDAIPDPTPILEDAGAQSINLSGISAGPGESQTLTVTATSSNPGLIPNPTVTYTSPNATGSLSFTPAANQSGTATITVTVTDDGGAANGGVNTITRTFTVTVNAVNDAPTLDAINDPAPILEDSGTQTINLGGIGAGPGESQSLTVTAVSSNPGLIPNPTVTYTSPDATGSLSFTPVSNASGTATITVTVTDNGGTANGGVNTVTRTFTVTINAVNDAPTLDVIADPAAILEDAGAQTINLTGISAGGGESQTLTITATSSNPGLIPDPTVTYTSPNATGSLSYTPVANASGTATITVTITDNGGTANGGVNTVTRTFTVTVTAVNDGPTLDVIPDPAPILEDAGTQTINLSGISAGSGESQTLTVTATSNNPGLIPNPIVSYTSPDATGSLSFTPVANASGTATITVTVTDDGGTANGGVNTIVRTFTVTVTAVNDAPTLDAINDPAPILEDAGAQTINLSGISAGGGESQNLTVTATSSNPGLIPDPTVTYTSPDATGSLSFTPVANASGTATITVTVTDNGGTASGGVNIVTRTFTVTVGAVNNAPTLDLITDPAPILEDAGTQSIDLSGITAGPSELQGLTVTATSSNPGLIPNPTVTYTSPNATGTLSYTPVADASGTATITVTITDDGGTANGGVNVFTRTFTVVVNAVNDAPTFSRGPDQSIVAGSGAQTVVGWASNLRAGPSDEVGQGLEFLVTNDNPGLFAVPPTIAPDGTLTYTPAADGSGTATVTVRLHDTGGNANGGVDTSAPVTLTVTLIPRPVVLSGALTFASDTGASHDDGLTNDVSPEFAGVATPGSFVVLFARRLDLPVPSVVGSARAGADGSWRLTTLALTDGTYVISANATGQGGVTGPLKTLGSITIDTVGPRITAAQLQARLGTILLAVQDDRSGLDQASLRTTANYLAARLGRPRPRFVPVTNVLLSGAGTPTLSETATVVVNGGRRLSRFVPLFLGARSGGIADLAGNALDGEFRGSLPTGDGRRGGDFAARFRLNRVRPFGLRPLTSGPFGVASSTAARSVPAGPLGRFATQR